MGEEVGGTKGLEKHLSANGVICSLVCASSANIGQHSGANGGSKRARKAQLWEILQGHLNRPFSEMLLRGDQGKMAEEVGRTKALEKLLSANNLIRSLVCILSATIGQHSGASGGSKSARKAKLWKSLKAHLNRPFSEIFLSGDQGKMAEKVGRTKGLEKHLSTNCVICSLVCASSANIGQHSGANGGSKSARKAQLWQILHGNLNRLFSEILHQGKMADKVGRIKRF